MSEGLHNIAPVLVVEDNEINAEILTTLLESCGIPNELAVDGLDALEKCSQRDKDYYSLILMDIHMPKLSGYEAADKIRNELKITTPIIAQTATHVTEDSIREHAGYINDYLYKPFKPDQLYSMIRKYLLCPAT
jgi:CheY-like chemotaxis protein